MDSEYIDAWFQPVEPAPARSVSDGNAAQQQSRARAATGAPAGQRDPRQRAQTLPSSLTTTIGSFINTVWSPISSYMHHNSGSSSASSSTGQLSTSVSAHSLPSESDLSSSLPGSDMHRTSSLDGFTHVVRRDPSVETISEEAVLRESPVEAVMLEEEEPTPEELEREARRASIAESLDEERVIALEGRIETTHALMTPEIAQQIRRSMPALPRLADRWNLVYSMDQHGISLATLYSRFQRVVSSNSVQPRGFVLIIQNSHGKLFGAYLSDPLKYSASSFYGTGETFVYDCNSAADGTTNVNIHQWTGMNDFFLFGDPKYFAVGAGDGKFAIYLDSDLESGKSHAVPTFNNPVLSTDESFTCYELEAVKGLVLQLNARQADALKFTRIEDVLLKLLGHPFSISNWHEKNVLKNACTIKSASVYKAHASPIFTTKPAPPEPPVDPRQLLQLTSQTRIRVVSDLYHFVVVLDLSSSVRSVSFRGVLLERVFDHFRALWETLSRAASSSKAVIELSILADVGATENPLRYLARVRLARSTSFKRVVRIISKMLDVDVTASVPSRLQDLLSVCLHTVRLVEGGFHSIVLITDGIYATGSHVPVLFELAARDIPVHVLLLEQHIKCFGHVPEVEILQHVTHSTGGKWLAGFDADELLLRDRSFQQRMPRQFNFDFSPPSHAHLAFPWDCSQPLPINCIPTRYRDYEVLLPLQVIRARLAQGFIILNVTMRERISVHMLLHWLPHVTLQYRIKSRLDWSAARVEINILAYSEFTMDLFKQSPAQHARSDVVGFHDFLKTLLDQDLAHKVITEVVAKISRNHPPGGGGGRGRETPAQTQTTVQIIESLLKTHAQWMDEETIDVAIPEPELLFALKQWASLEVGAGSSSGSGRYYVQLGPNADYGGGFGFAAITAVAGSRHHSSWRCLYFGYRSVPDILQTSRFHGAISIAHGPYVDMNRALLKHRQYVYTVSPDLLQRMSGLTVQHHTQQGYAVVDSGSDFIVLAKDTLQCRVHSKDQQLIISNYQLPVSRKVESRNLTEKLSAMYTIDCLLHNNVPEDDRLFSLHNVLTHSKMTILGTSLQINVPVTSLTRTVKRHLAASCMSLECSFDHDNVHHAIHQYHGLEAPLSSFDCFIYVSVTVMIFFVPRDTRVPYTIVYECLVDKMSYHVWDSVPLCPHSRAPQTRNALVSTFYYTSYHVTTQDIEGILYACTWPAAVECVYSLSHQLHPRDVALCIEALHEVSASLDISRLMLVFERLRAAAAAADSPAAGAKFTALIQDAVAQFGKQLNGFMRIIPDSAFFTLIQPYYFSAMTFTQPDHSRRVTALPVAPAPPLNLGEHLAAAGESLTLPSFPLELHLCFYSLERDAPALTSIIDAHMADLNAHLRQTIARLLLHLDHVSLERVQLVLKELNILQRHAIPLPLFKGAPAPLLLREMERAHYGAYHCVRLDGCFYLVPRATPSDGTGSGGNGGDSRASPSARASLDLDADDLEAGLGIILPPQKDAHQQSNRSSLDLVSATDRRGSTVELGPMREWIIFMPEGSSSITLFAQSAEVVSLFQAVAQEVAHMLNTRMLLMELRDTHTSSKYLIMPDNPEPRDKELSGAGGSARKGKAMAIGQFACPAVFTHTFPLHWRLKPMAALNSVAGMLSSLSVNNRRNVFVMSPGAPGDEIYYMQLSETCAAALPSTSTPMSSMTGTGGAGGGAGGGGSLNSTPAVASSASQMGMADDDSNTTSPSTPSSTQRKLVISLHGIDPPSKEFTNEVLGMISARITHVVLQHVSTHLSRNAVSLLRLTKADVDFLLPLSRGPRITRFIQLGTEPSATYLTYFRQSMLLFTTILGGADVAQTLMQHLQIRYDVAGEPSDMSPGDMAFLYCGVSTRNPSAAEAAIGQGIGCVCLYLSRDGEVLLHHPESADGLEWMVEVWSHGSVHLDALVDHVRLAHEQAVFDVDMDRIIRDRTFAEIPQSMAARGPACAHPCFHIRTFPVRLAAWKLKPLAAHLAAATAGLGALAPVPDPANPRALVQIGPSTPSDELGFYATHTHYLRSDKIARVNVSRTLLVLVLVEPRAIHAVAWDVKAATFTALGNAVAAFLDTYSGQMQRVQDVAMAKLGFRDREVQSFPPFARHGPRAVDAPGACTEIGSAAPLPSVAEVSGSSGSVAAAAVEEPAAAATAAPSIEETVPEVPLAEEHVKEYEEFLASYTRERERSEYFCTIYNRWRQRHQRYLSGSDGVEGDDASKAVAKRQGSPPPPAAVAAGQATRPVSPSSKVSDLDLKHVLRFARLIHWCRTPLVFNARAIDQFSFASAPLTSNADDTRAYMARLAATLLNQYCHYLGTLGLVVVSRQADRDTLLIGPDLTVPSDRVYMQKSFQGGILLVEVSLKHIFLAVNLYTVNRRYGPHQQRLPSPGFNVPDYSRQSFRLFAEECSKFKNLIHVNSFAFDFHIRTVWNLIAGSAVTVFSVIDVLRTLLLHFPPAGYSRCRLFHGVVAEPNSQLVSYLFSHPMRFRLGLMTQSNAFFITWTRGGSDGVGGADGGHDASPLIKYLAVLRQVPTGIEYFVLECTGGTSLVSPTGFPHVTLPRKRTEVMEPPPASEDVQAQAQATISELVQRAAAHLARDQQWRSLLDADHRGGTREWFATAREFFCVSLVALDPSMHMLLSIPGDWDAISAALETEWPYGVRAIGEDGKLRMFVNPNDSAMYLLSLHPPHVNVVIRDEKEQNVGAAVEFFVRALTRALWRCLATAMG
ncbi:hypothetical protein H9P43_006234 [Blastocladiella emersonii ATCC 22665]|nr:hypothetical protein H9P43_006234 [Blastocladiella emersonii ATCC 22665]